LPRVALGATALEILRTRLGVGGYTQTIVEDAERIAPGLFDAIRLPIVRWRLAQRSDDAAVLARLFEYADDLPAEDVTRILAPDLVATLLEAGWFARTGGTLAARVRITPFDGLFIVSDPHGAGLEAVMGPSVTTQMLMAGLRDQAPASVLDVGCGAGTLALCAARRGAARVVAVDISTRAVDLTRLNAALNGLRVDVRQGDLTAPARGEMFDLVVSQPPYVVRPDVAPTTTYLHGGADGDEIALRLLGEVPAALAAGGLALVLFDTAVRKDAPPVARVRERLGAEAVDLAILAAHAPSADQQATAYAAATLPTLGDDYARLVVRYASHLEARGLGTWARLLAVVARPLGTAPAGGRFTASLLVPTISGLGRDEIDAYLAALEVGALPPEALRRRRIRPHAAARIAEERSAIRPDEDPVRRVSFTGVCLAAAQELSDAAFVLVDLLARADDVGEAVQGYAEACGAMATEVEAQVIGFVREGLVRGLLRPA